MIFRKGSEKSVIKDITKTKDNTPKNLSSLQFLSPSGKKKSQYSLTDVLEWIYKYSNDTYGKYGEPSIYAGDTRIVSKIRVNLFCCLSYKKKKNCDEPSSTEVFEWDQPRVPSVAKGNVGVSV